MLGYDTAGMSIMENNLFLFSLSLSLSLSFSFSLLGATSFRNAYFGQRYGPIVLDNLGCTGTEQSLFNCSGNAIGVHNCDHSEDAGVRCTGAHIVYILLCILFPSPPPLQLLFLLLILSPSPPFLFLSPPPFSLSLS